MARFWEEIGDSPTAAVIVDRAVRVHMREFDQLNETLSEADQTLETSVVREIMSKVDQAVEASSPDEPVFATCAKVYNDWEATRSADAHIALGFYVDDLWPTYGTGYPTIPPRYHPTSGSQSIAAFVRSSSW